MEVKPTLACGLQICIGKAWTEDQYSDFTVVVGGTSYPCHRFILSACSGFFKRLFRSQLKECLEGCVKLDRISQETFDVIIKSIYEGTDGLTEDNVFDVWSAAEQLQIDYLTQECKEFIKSHISVDNCFRYLNYTLTFWPHVMCYTCLNFIACNFEQVKNVTSFLQLPFVYFNKVITSDNLAASSEDSVVEAIIKWVEYVPETLDRQTANAVQHLADVSTHSVTVNGNQERGSCDQASKNIDYTGDIFSRLRCAELKSSSFPDASSNGLYLLSEAFSKVFSNLKGAEAQHPVIVPAIARATLAANLVPGACQTESQEDRKQKFLQMISVCKLFLANPACLENLLKNCRDFLISTGSYELVLKAILYTLSVGRRHDSWPEGAIHRDSSSNKHVMVYFSKNQFKAHMLNTGNVHGFAKVPTDYNNRYANGRITVFDNVLYFMYEDTDKCIKFNVLTKQKEWAPVNYTGMDVCSRKMLLAHGSYIYDFKVENNTFMLCRYSCIHGDREWTKPICVSKTTKNCLIRFQQYIIVFGTKKNVVTACYFNTETETTHICNPSMDGTSQDMMSFCVGEDVYILQKNGTLWKIFSTEINPVNFELICKLWWDFDSSLRGCVLYRKKLFIFHNDQFKSTKLRPFIRGIYVDIEMIQVNTRMQCVPMVLPESWLD